jgi:hypothetical protein
MTDRHGAMNNTKWEELRLAMYGISSLHQAINACALAATTRMQRPNGLSLPKWRIRRRSICRHIRGKPTSSRADQKRPEDIHLPGEETNDGFRVYGYALPGQTLDYL